MKVALLLVAVFGYLANDAAARPGIADELPYFDESQLSANFRGYEVSGCTNEVNQCLRQVHEGVQQCLAKWKEQAGARYQHCATNDPVVLNASRDWQVPSQKWHKAMDQCLAGNQPPSEEALQSLAIETAAMSFYSRKKRDADAVATCWRTIRQKRDQCNQKAVQCTQFAHCYGEGPEPSEESAKRWYKFVKRLRNETKQKSKIHIMHMGHCLRNEPHTSGDHGGGHGMHGGHEHRFWR